MVEPSTNVQMYSKESNNRSEFRVYIY